MTAVMKGVRIVRSRANLRPAASALLADYGAEFIKIERRRAWRRDARPRGTAVIAPGDVHVLLEHSNRGKQSLALDSRATRVATSCTAGRDPDVS